MENDLSIFISYASPDRDRVLPYYTLLRDQGYNPWIDKTKLLGGQSWDFEIRKALNRSSLIVMFISNNSVNRQGYVQREIKLALTKLEEKVIGDIYIIPVLLDEDAQRPEQLSSIQFLNAQDEEFEANLLAAIQHQLQDAETASAAWTNESGIGWSKSIISEEWSGVPGYTFNGEILHLTSSKFKNLKDCSDIFLGWLKGELLRERAVIFEQSGSLFNMGQERERRSNTWDAYCADPIMKGRVLSVKYTVGWYGAGAAHPNYGFQTYCFFLDPVTLIGSLPEIFINSDEVLEIIQASLFDELSNQGTNDNDSEDSALDPDSIKSGIDNWDMLDNFLFVDDGIEFVFGPYQVGPYALGPQSAIVPYGLISEHMNETVRSALDLLS